MARPKCPKCQAEVIENDQSECRSCGIIFKKYYAKRKTEIAACFTEVCRLSLRKRDEAFGNLLKKYPELYTPLCNLNVAISKAIKQLDAGQIENAKLIFDKIGQKYKTLLPAIEKELEKADSIKEFSVKFQKGVRAYNEERFTDARLIFKKLKNEYPDRTEIDDYFKKISSYIGEENPPLPKQNTPTNTNGQVVCPKCGSSSISAVKEGFKADNACCGAILLGPLGLLCGAAGSNVMFNVCQSCGKKWQI